ncbi:MAG TPA: protein kinase, partial [Candidatus Krumholzibacteria bacterium]|nr:protein kinase [Candidatus Krumholzibacteria bacterium]
MPLTPGTKLGPYEIVAPLGAGGMGEVYRARDSRLNREVAVKVLPKHLSERPEVRARFEREAKTISSLNHPHICTLFDIGREGETDFLVMELIDGETLAARIARGPLPLDEVFRLGMQIADALDRAHRSGIVHRDLKPGNIMLTKSGAKLMDFGLARASGIGGAGSGSGTMDSLGQSPTIAQPLTAEGTIVGTFQYMAPEQLEGKEADARSDIWSLGCVLYEMMTGRHAFEGTSQASLIAAIINSAPVPVSQVAPMSPPAVDRLVRQCLTRDPDERWQSAGDVRRELEWIGTSSSQAAAVAAAPIRRHKVPRGTWGILGGVAVALLAVVWALGPWNPHSDEALLVRFDIEAPAGTSFKMPAETALSPDGSMIVFVARDSTFDSHLYLRPLSSRDARLVPGTAGSGLPFWSPDGRMLGFFAEGKLLKVALDGSPPVALCDAPDPRGGDWSRDGVILFAANNQGPISRVSSNGGTPVKVTTVDESRGDLGHRYPQFLPDGEHFLYVAVGSSEKVTTFVASLDGGTPKELIQTGSMARWAEPGYLLFLDSGVSSPRRRLLAQRFDPSSRQLSGDALLLVDPVSATNFGYSNAATDQNGSLIVQHQGLAHSRLTWRDRTGAVVDLVREDIVAERVALSPDGTRLAFSNPAVNDIFILDLQTKVETRLTFQGKRVIDPVWSPDGRTIAFARISASAGWDTYTKVADGTGPDAQLFKGPGLFAYPLDWSSDGRWLVDLCTDASGNYDLWKVPMSGGGEPEIYQHTPAAEISAFLSADGRWILYSAREGETPAIFLQSFPKPGAKYQLAVPGGTVATWRDRMDEILVLTTQGELLAVDVDLKNGFRQGATHNLFRLTSSEFIEDVTQDHQRFLVSERKDNS